MKRFKILLKIGLFLVMFSRCERDDICLEGTQGTPQLIIRFYDANDNAVPKIPDQFHIRAIGSPFELTNSASDSISIPLNPEALFSEFEFITRYEEADQNVDTLQFRYRRYDEYLNRSCGYRARFIFNATAVEIRNSSGSWILGHTVLTDTIADETLTHLALYH